MTTIYFVRHAEPNYDNHDDVNRELSAKGLADRRRVTEYLRDKDIDVVYSSPYKRAVDTVKDFADTIGMEIIKNAGFQERKIDGVWLDDFHSFARRQWEDFSYKMPAGECLLEVQERNIAALNELLDAYPNKNIVIGSHGTALSTIINFYQPEFGYEEFERIRTIMPWIVKFTFDGHQCIQIQEISVLEHE